MPAILRCLVLASVAILLVAEAAARTPRRVCRLACAEPISACISAGNRPRACRRSYVPACRKLGVKVCQPSTTTTLTTQTTQTTTTTGGLVTTTTSTSLSPKLSLSVLAWARYSIGDVYCPAVEAVLVQFDTQALTWDVPTDGLYGDTYWYFGPYSCHNGQLSVSSAIRDDFFDFIFPDVTLDPSAGVPCSAARLLPRTGRLQCTVFMGRGNLIYSGIDTLSFSGGSFSCYASVRFGCQDEFTPCTPLPVTSTKSACPPP